MTAEAIIQAAGSKASEAYFLPTQAVHDADLLRRISYCREHPSPNIVVRVRRCRARAMPTSGALPLCQLVLGWLLSL